MTTYSKFLKLEIELDELARLVARAVGRTYRLRPLDVRCTFPVFRGEAAGAEPVFVKVGSPDEWRRTQAFLREVGTCDLFARMLTAERLDYRGFAVFVSEWRDLRPVPAEDMNAAQARSFVDGCVRLSAVLQGVTSFTPLAGSPLAPERLFGVLEDYAARHPTAAKGLASLLSIPAAERTFPRLYVVHGDFHAKNYGFDGDRFAGVFDFDKLTEGAACGDFANALAERFSLLSLPSASRARLEAVTREVLALSPWRCADLVAAVNVCRLRFAARRIEKHPDSLWVVFDILRRDRRIARLLKLVQEVKG